MTSSAFVVLVGWARWAFVGPAVTPACPAACPLRACNLQTHTHVSHGHTCLLPQRSICSGQGQPSSVPAGIPLLCAHSLLAHLQGIGTHTGGLPFRCCTHPYVQGTAWYAPTMQCRQCPPGEFAAPGDPSCSRCPPGAYSAGVQSSSCTPCLPGTSSLAVGATSAEICVECPAGSYSGGCAWWALLVSHRPMCITCSWPILIGPGAYPAGVPGAGNTHWLMSCTACQGWHTAVGNLPSAVTSRLQATVVHEAHV